jgi:NADH:ubiquinone oxidoreductase subunit K
MIRILIGTELILSAAMLNLVVFSMSNAPFDQSGLVATLFIIAMAAAETIIGLILLILLYKDIGAIDISLGRSQKDKKERTRFRRKKKEIAEEAC